MGEWRLVQLGCSMRSNNEDGGEWDAMARLSFTARIHPRPKEPAKDKRKMMSCGFFKKLYHERKNNRCVPWSIAMSVILIKRSSPASDKPTSLPVLYIYYFFDWNVLTEAL